MTAPTAVLLSRVLIFSWSARTSKFSANIEPIEFAFESDSSWVSRDRLETWDRNSSSCRPICRESLLYQPTPAQSISADITKSALRLVGGNIAIPVEC